MNPASSTTTFGYSFGALALSVLLSLGTFTYVHAATVLVDDQFNDGGLTDGADPLDAAWTRISSNAGNISVTSNALTHSATFSVARGLYTNTTALTNGGENDSITLSMDLRATSTPAASNAGFRFGFGNTANTYVFHIGTGGTASGGFIQWAGMDVVAGTSTIYTTSPTPDIAQSITDTAYHTFSMTITRSGASSLSFSATLDGTTYTSVTSNNISNFTFDRVILGSGGTAIPFAVDNVNVTLGAIPEPSTYAAFAGLAALGLAAFKRSRNSR